MKMMMTSEEMEMEMMTEMKMKMMTRVEKKGEWKRRTKEREGRKKEERRRGKGSTHLAWFSAVDEPLAQLSNVLHCPVNATTHGA